MAPRTLLMAALAALLTATSAIALSSKQCVQFDDPALLFEHSDVVFVGEVVAANTTGVEGEHVISHRATLRVDRIWKGQRQRQFAISADRPFRVAGRYIVFAGGNPLFTTLMCKASELEEEAERKREWLATKPSRRPR